MNTEEVKSQFGVGLYTPAEAAFLTRTRPETLNRWLFGDSKGAGVVTPRFEGSQQRIVSFTDLMQVVAIRTLRQSPKAKAITLQHIREVVAECAERGYDYPLAKRHTLYAFGNKLLLRIQNQDGEDVYTGVANKDRDQLFQNPIIEPFLSEVEYGQDDLMFCWKPMQLGDYRIVLDKNRRFGMPLVEPYGISAFTLAESAQAEGSIEAAADSHEVSRDAVSLALKYVDSLTPAA